MQMFSCKTQSVRVGGLLNLLIPAVQEICISDQQNPIFHEFYNTLIRGSELIKKCESSSTINLPLNYRYASQIVKLEKEIDGFMKVIPACTLLEARGMLADLKKNYTSEASDISKELENSIFKQASMLTTDPCENAKMLQQPVLDDLLDCTESIEDTTSSYHSNGSGISQFFVGLEKPIAEVKELLFNTEVSVVGVQCMGGGGKTTLALALCDDPKIKCHFGNNVFFFTVSQSPNLKGILESLWEKIVAKKKPDFQNVEDAHRHLEQQLLQVPKPTLVILDDVWSRANLEKLLFEGPGYKTLITTRDSSTIPRNLSTQSYQLPLLGHEDALALFCFWAFGQTSIPCTFDANLVEEVQAECKGLPLALKVIGSSLHGEPRVVWESAKNKLSKGEFISDYHKEALYKCLETSVYLLDDVVRECFIDLGAFPEDRKICADALLDVWVYFRNLEWQDALAILLELASRNLLNLSTSSNPGSGAAISHGSVSELYFTQHDVMRDLALNLGSQGDIVHRKRLLMPRKEYTLPEKWALHRDRQFDAQIVSIHTGPMEENQWYEMNFPEAEALILVFTASEYYLPPFLKSMKKLKFLMVFNYGTKRATVKGLTQLKSVRLERVIAPAVLNQSKALQNLEKLSLSLCEGFKNPSTFNNTKLQGFNMDHCSDLEELPQNICYMPYAQMWSITNCHQVQKLPYDLGNLSSLKVLRLSSLPGLKELPSSIGNLGGLEYLDISVCVGLKELPEQIGQLKKLTELDMRECSRLKRLPRSVCGLTSLKHVTCDEKIGKQWLLAKRIALPELKVEIVEVQFSLDWLDD
ncbi:putative disease resistance protein At5g47280 [Cryptomeria japonica]|uniref:putative disease resistance protein At5g47280 n=1 Tax=Cryptomeria japonica TaxID=3369 RepID=UPI0027DA8AB2|nr:putative disease resistance protein At5g47280 [Cryptomeria japonica]